MKHAGLIASVVAAVGSTALGHLYLERLEQEVSGGPPVAVLMAAPGRACREPC